MSATPNRTLDGATTRTQWAWTAATFFGIGFLKPGPGTWASLAAMGIWFLAAHWTHLSVWELALATIGAGITVTLLGIAASSVVERESGKEDPGYVVIDEVAGQWIAL